MGGSRRIPWLVFTIGVLAVVDVLGWVTWRMVRLEEDQARTRAETARQEAIGRALWRMDSIVLPILAVESARPYFEYQAFYPANRAFDRMWDPVGEGDVLVPSPLLGEAGDFVQLHFERRADGRLTSPQAPPQGPTRDAAIAAGVPSVLLSMADLRLYELDRVGSRRLSQQNEARQSESASLQEPINATTPDFASATPPAPTASLEDATSPEGLRELISNERRDAGNPFARDAELATQRSAGAGPDAQTRSLPPDESLEAGATQTPVLDRVAGGAAQPTQTAARESAEQQSTPPDPRQDLLARQQAANYAQNYNDAGRSNRSRQYETRGASNEETQSRPAGEYDRAAETVPLQAPESEQVRREVAPGAPLGDAATPPPVTASPGSPNAAAAARTQGEAGRSERAGSASSPTPLMPLDASLDASRSGGSPTQPPATPTVVISSEADGPAEPPAVSFIHDGLFTGSSQRAPSILSNSNPWSEIDPGTAPVGIDLATLADGSPWGDQSRWTSDQRLPALAAATSATRPDSGALTPAWRGDPGSPEAALVLTRGVTINGETREQGVWIDWPALRRALESSVSDLFPLAEVRPVNFSAGRGSVEAESLATIPVVLIPGPLAEGILPAMPAFWTPTRWTLLVGWIAVAIAVVAIGIVLRKAIDLGERRGRFVSAVTHELRTPLTTFRLYSQMLAGGTITDETKKTRYAQTLDRESQRLTGIVESVLEYARLGRRASSGTSQKIDAGSVIDRVRPALAGRCERAGMELVMPEPAEVPSVRVLADSDKLERILLNLVDNACKYASEAADRRIIVAVTQNEGRLILSVRDHGPGVPAAERRRIFNAFHRAKHHDQSASPGLGLGLALSRGLAREMGGELRLIESETPGAAFELALPIA